MDIIRLTFERGSSQDDFKKNSRFYFGNIRFSAKKYKEWYNLIKDRKIEKRAKFIF